MIKVVPMYTVICDRCGTDSSEECEYSGWNEIFWAEDTASEQDWKKIKDKDYCPDCWEINDNDELVIKKPLIKKPL